MINRKRIDRVCLAGTAVMLGIVLLLLACGGTFLQAAAIELPYTQKLFSADSVHRIDLVVEESDWESMLENATQEEYISCTAVIDNEKFANAAIRPKGNSSLTTVANSESDRYSFKLEFDHYDKNSSYYGLDKLCLNNAIQDNTCMKDFLCCQMMSSIGADAPLSSFVWITVNGEDWGLYTAVEGIEDGFARRVYGTEPGQIYKPDSMDMGGGGRGAEKNGRAEAGEMPQMGGAMGGSGDVLLQYSDDDPDSYPNIFDNTVLGEASEAEKARLIQALKELGGGEVESCLNTDEILRYFAVHNFVLNEDSYTGTMIHNYYLREKEGKLSMIPWDYNLAFGGMGGGQDASALVNSPIDSPVSSGEIEDRPMVAWIFSEGEYTGRYHQILSQWIADFFDSGKFEALIDSAVQLISPYVGNDPTAFCTYEEFLKGAETLKEFCLLRAESIRGQLSGTIPSTAEGQAEDSSGFVDASAVSVSDMGSQGGMQGGMRPMDSTRFQNGGGMQKDGGPGTSDGQDSGATPPEAPGEDDSPPAMPDAQGFPDLPQGEAPPGAPGEQGDSASQEQADGVEGEAAPFQRGAGGFRQPLGGMTAPDFAEEGGGASGQWETALLLGASFLVLLGGLAFAKLYR